MSDHRWSLWRLRRDGPSRPDGRWCIGEPDPFYVSEVIEHIEVMPVVEHERLRDAAQAVVDADDEVVEFCDHEHVFARAGAIERLAAVLKGEPARASEGSES